MTAQPESPLQDWVGGWVDFLGGAVPAIFLVVVLAAGIGLLVRPRGKKGKGGGLRKAIAFGIGAALVFLLLTNVEAVADWFRAELPLGE